MIQFFKALFDVIAWIECAKIKKIREARVFGEGLDVQAVTSMRPLERVALLF